MHPVSVIFGCQIAKRRYKKGFKCRLCLRSLRRNGESDAFTDRTVIADGNRLAEHETWFLREMEAFFAELPAPMAELVLSNLEFLPKIDAHVERILSCIAEPH